jgi:hypothetical protein
MSEVTELILARAESMWREPVHDPALTDRTPEAMIHRENIQLLINAGLGVLHWECHSPKSKGQFSKGHVYKKRVKDYCGDLCTSWCGSLPAWSWLGAGLTQGVRRQLASTYRIAELIEDEDERRVRPDKIQPADVVCVKGRGKHPLFGDHIVLVRDVVGDSFTTFEGNGHGKGPDGELYQGVVSNVRKRSEIVQALRPLPRDLLPPARMVVG